MKYQRSLGILFLCLILLAHGCQSIQNYNNYLVDKSYATEIPTLMGNLIGGVATTPLLLVTFPTSYLISEQAPQQQASQQQEQPTQDRLSRSDYIITPIKGGSYVGGVILGTPFLPLGFLLPKTTLEREQEQETP